MRRLGTLGCLLALGGCGSLPLPQSLGEQASGYGYVPLDGLAVHTYPYSKSCLDYRDPQNPQLKNPIEYVPIPQALPDISIRFAIADITADGSVSYGPGKVTAAGQDYKAVLDDVNVDAIPEFFYVRRYIQTYDKATKTWTNSKPVGLREAAPKGAVNLYEVRLVPPELVHPGKAALPAKATDTEKAAAEAKAKAKADKMALVEELTGVSLSDPNAQYRQLTTDGWQFVTIPIYVGIGTRLTAHLHSFKGGIAITGLASIGASATAGRLSGSVTEQALGINTQAIGVGMPISVPIDQGSIQNAMLALGAIRAEFYHTSDTGSVAFPEVRVVGLYSPIGTDSNLINGIYSELSAANIQWSRPCIAPGFNTPPYGPPTGPQITTKSLPAPLLGKAYSQKIGTQGVTPPITFSYSGGLPDGLSLDTSTGLITGTPKASGPYNFSIMAQGAGSSTPPQVYSGTFVPQAP